MPSENPAAGVVKAKLDAFILEADLDCPACDGAVERNQGGALECDMCGRQWTDDEVASRNKRSLA